jgi:hypothetical protein
MGDRDDEHEALRIADRANSERIFRAYAPLARVNYRPASLA